MYVCMDVCMFVCIILFELSLPLRKPPDIFLTEHTVLLPGQDFNNLFYYYMCIANPISVHSSAPVGFGSVQLRQGKWVCDCF